MKKYFIHPLFALIILWATNPVFSQTSPKIIEVKKGEVFDLLLLRQKPDTKADLKAYFQTATPVAKRMSYQSLSSFRISQHTQGNHQPTLFILAKWSDLEQREAFLSQILDEVPDFHERRRKIWSYFGLSYYEMQENLSFAIDRNQYHVATAYWLQEGHEKSTFYNKWLKKVKHMGGKILLQLDHGTSPFGYQYDPTYFVVSSWKTEADFEAFQKEIQQLKHDHIQHVNEFILE